MKINFTKMHGLGNDFILIDCLKNEFGVRGQEFGELSKELCHRRFGIGADQMLLLCPSTAADFKMLIFNSDGSEVEMCGNGIRCLAKYVWDRGLSDKDVLEVETLAGIIRPEKHNDLVRVDMGEPVFEPERIPVKISNESLVTSNELKNKKDYGDLSLVTRHSSLIIDYPLQIEDREFKITCVSMGNPHAVIVVDKAKDFPVAYYGERIENNPLFPKRTNVEFIEVLNSSEIRMRVWERGSGETMACGTGAAASAAASHIKGYTGRDVTVHLAGGDLNINWAEDNHIYMKGPATEVFTGTINIRGRRL
jgi:diaminopimelate epimerase